MVNKCRHKVLCSWFGKYSSPSQFFRIAPQAGVAYINSVCLQYTTSLPCMFVWYFKVVCIMITSWHGNILRFTRPLHGFDRSPEDSPLKMATEIPAHSEGCYVQNTFSPVHYSDAIMGAMASHTTGVSIIYSIIFSGVDQRKYQTSASLAYVRETHWWPTEFPQKGLATQKMLPFDDVIMSC